MRLGGFGRPLTWHASFPLSVAAGRRPSSNENPNQLWGIVLVQGRIAISRVKSTATLDSGDVATR